MTEILDLIGHLHKNLHLQLEETKLLTFHSRVILGELAAVKILAWDQEVVSIVTSLVAEVDLV